MTTNANTRPSEYVPSEAEVEAAMTRLADWMDYYDLPSKEAMRAVLIAARTVTPCHPYDEVCRPGGPCRNHGGTVTPAPLEEHDRLRARQWANQIGVDHCDCASRRPTPPADMVPAAALTVDQALDALDAASEAYRDALEREAEPGRTEFRNEEQG